MRLADVVAVLDRHAPPQGAESWDNVGLLVGDPAADVSRAMLCIDYTAAVAAEAAAAGCDLVVAYHPPVFKPLKRLTANGDAAFVFDAVARGVAIYSPHTALDAAEGGTNDVLADVVGLIHRRPLRPGPATATGTGTGTGRVGELVDRVEHAVLFDRIKGALKIDYLLVAGPAATAARTVAICAGSGGDLLDDAIAAKADLYLTGELRHHGALRAAAAGLTVVCTLHSHSERVTLRHWLPRLAIDVPAVEWRVSIADVDPFAIV